MHFIPLTPISTRTGAHSNAISRGTGGISPDFGGQGNEVHT